MRRKEEDQEGVGIDICVVEPCKLDLGRDEGLRIADQFERLAVRRDFSCTFPVEIDRAEKLKGNKKGQEQNRESGYVCGRGIMEPPEPDATLEDEGGKGEEAENG